MNAAEIINAALRAKGWTQKLLAATMGQSPQSLNKKLVNNTISAREFFEAAGHLGYEVRLVEVSSNEELRTRVRGVGPRLRRMVNGVIYDTFKADAICHTPWSDGWFMELYRDAEDRYFVAHYTLWEKGVEFISPCGDEDAERLYAEYGNMEIKGTETGIA